MKMKITAIVAIVILTGTAGIATPQRGDRLSVGGKSYSVYGPSINQYYGSHSNTIVALSRALAPEQLGMSSSCWSGYWAVWEVRGDRLFLTSVCTPGDVKKIPLEILFPGSTNGHFASWYEGTMESPRVRLRYVHAGVGGDYVYWKTFTFRDGKLVSIGFYPDRFIVFWVLIPLLAATPIVASLIILRMNNKKQTSTKSTVPSEGAP